MAPFLFAEPREFSARILTVDQVDSLLNAKRILVTTKPGVHHLAGLVQGRGGSRKEWSRKSPWGRGHLA